MLLPRGNGKSMLMGALAVHHALTVPRPAVYIAASSRDQARVIFEYARVFATDPAIAEQVVVRHLELRVAGGFVRVLASDAPKLHGLTPSLAIIDELHAFRDGEVYLALRTAKLKRAGSRMLTISTAAQGAGSPLGQLRARALAAPKVTRRGALTDARAPTLRMLEWAVPDDASVDDTRKVKQANPASWIGAAALREQRAAVPDLAYRRYHCGQWTAREGAAFPAGAWSSCVGEPTFADGEPIFVGVDVGGERSASAVVWVNEALHVGATIYHGDEGVIRCIEKVRELADQYTLEEVCADPWRWGQAAQELEREGLVVSLFPQTDARMVPASDRLYRAITEQRLVLPADDELAEHAANAVQRHSRRGWRFDKPDRSSPMDSIIALCMALERLENRPEPAALVGWL